MTAILGLGAAPFPCAAPAGPVQVDPALTREDGPLQVLNSLKSLKSGRKP